MRTLALSPVSESAPANEAATDDRERPNDPRGRSRADRVGQGGARVSWFAALACCAFAWLAVFEQPAHAQESAAAVAIAQAQSAAPGPESKAGGSPELGVTHQVAQVDVERGETVRGRPRPDYEALGGRVGSFIAYPKVTVGEFYNDNIFVTEDDEVDDFITVIEPTLEVKSDWGRHALSFEGGAEFGLYADETDENYQDYFAGAASRFDISESTYLGANGSFQHLHEDRGDPDDVQGEEPTEYNRFGPRLEGFHDLGRVNLTLGGGFLRLDYDDVDAAVGGGEINNDDRDRDRFNGSLRVGYEIVPEYEAFVRGGFDVVDYDDSVDDNGFDRDSEGFDVVGGVKIDFGGLIFGDFFAGYSYRNYDDSDLDTIDGVDVGADFTWNVTPLTTITGGVARIIEETTQNSASGRYVTTGTVGVDHELLRNLIVGASGGIENDDYEGISREDWIYTAGASVDYFLNRYVFMGADYSFRHRDSDETGIDDYYENIVGVTLGVQY
jgi:hypothetical protein